MLKNDEIIELSHIEEEILNLDRENFTEEELYYINNPFTQEELDYIDKIQNEYEKRYSTI